MSGCRDCAYLAVAVARLEEQVAQQASAQTTLVSALENQRVRFNAAVVLLAELELRVLTMQGQLAASASSGASATPATNRTPLARVLD